MKAFTLKSGIKQECPLLLFVWILFHSKHKRLKLKKTRKFLFFPPWNCFLDPLCLLWNLRIWVKTPHFLVLVAKLSPEVFEALTVGSYPFILSALFRKMKKKKKKTLFKEETIFATEHYFYSLSKSAKSNVPFYVYTYENIVLSINSLRKKPTARPYADSHLPQSKEFWGTNYVVGKLQVFSVDKSSIPGASLSTS